MLTLNEIYHKSVGGIAAQRAICKNQAGDCVYRNAEGKACAVGQLIEDQYYKEDFEGVGIRYVKSEVQPVAESSLREALFKSGVDIDDNSVFELLKNLQSNHDDAESVEEFMELVRPLAPTE